MKKAGLVKNHIDRASVHSMLLIAFHLFLFFRPCNIESISTEFHRRRCCRLFHHLSPRAKPCCCLWTRPSFVIIHLFYVFILSFHCVTCRAWSCTRVVRSSRCAQTFHRSSMVQKLITASSRCFWKKYVQAAKFWRRILRSTSCPLRRSPCSVAATRNSSTLSLSRHAFLVDFLILLVFLIFIIT